MSIATLGFERFAATVTGGTLVKIYDLRMPGQKVYTYRNATSVNSVHEGNTDELYPNHTVWGTTITQDIQPATYNPKLCTGSSFGRTLYAGFKRTVAEMDFCDRYPKSYTSGVKGYTYNEHTGMIRQFTYNPVITGTAGSTMHSQSIIGLDPGWISSFWLVVPSCSATSFFHLPFKTENIKSGLTNSCISQYICLLKAICLES